MNELMNEMIEEASIKASEHGYGFAHREIDLGKVKCRILLVNTNSKQSLAQKIWWLNGKRIAAKKLLAS